MSYYNQCFTYSQGRNSPLNQRFIFGINTGGCLV